MSRLISVLKHGVSDVSPRWGLWWIRGMWMGAPAGQNISSLGFLTQGLIVLFFWDIPFEAVILSFFVVFVCMSEAHYPIVTV